ncbi:MAG: phage major capsid protein [Gemmatimonadota bacterium]
MSGLTTAVELRQERARLHGRSSEILKEARESEDGLSSEQRTELDGLDTRMAELLADAKRLELHEERERELNESRGRRSTSDLSDPGELTAEQRAERNRNAMRLWFLKGSDEELSDGDEALAAEFSRSKTVRLKLGDSRLATSVREQRAQSVGTDSEGGYTVPEGFSNELEKALLAFGGMRRARTRIMRTPDGRKIPWPTYNDTANTGAIIGENIADSEQDVAFSEAELDAYKYTSRIIRVPVELLQDSFFDMPSFLGGVLGERIGRITNTHFTTGSGSGQPNGVATASAAGITAAAQGAVTFPELIQLEHSVDEAYRSQAQYMFSDATLSAIRQLLDGDGRPLWQPGLTVGAPDSINGKSYVVNNDVADMAASARAILFGDFSKYVIRDVMDVSLTRMDERYGEFHQVAFVAISRHDGELIDAGTNPIKRITMAA